MTAEVEPRGTRVSGPLIEVRTVLGRASTARDLLAHRYRGRDPEEAEILADLEAVVERLEKWRRTGRSRR